jgi:hypothetical protein
VSLPGARGRPVLTLALAWGWLSGILARERSFRPDWQRMMQLRRQSILLLAVYAAHVWLPLGHTLQHSDRAAEDACSGCLAAGSALRAACPGSCQDPEHDHHHDHHGEGMCLLVKATSAAPVLPLFSGGPAAAVPVIRAPVQPFALFKSSADGFALIIRGPPLASSIL